MKMQVCSLASLSGLRIQHCHKQRSISDVALLWLWCRLAAAIQPLAWDFPYAAGVALKRKKKKKKKTNVLANVTLLSSWLPWHVAKQTLQHFDLRLIRSQRGQIGICLLLTEKKIKLIKMRC